MKWPSSSARPASYIYVSTFPAYAAPSPLSVLSLSSPRKSVSKQSNFKSSDFIAPRGTYTFKTVPIGLSYYCITKSLSSSSPSIRVRSVTILFSLISLNSSTSFSRSSYTCRSLSYSSKNSSSSSYCPSAFFFASHSCYSLIFLARANSLRSCPSRTSYLIWACLASAASF